MSPFNPELSAVPGITGLARWGEQWWHRGGGAKVRAILVKEAFVRPASVNPRASLPTAGARGGLGTCPPLEGSKAASWGHGRDRCVWPSPSGGGRRHPTAPRSQMAHCRVSSFNSDLSHLSMSKRET